MNCQNFWRTNEVDYDVQTADLQLGEKKNELKVQYYFHFGVRKSSSSVV